MKALSGDCRRVNRHLAYIRSGLDRVPIADYPRVTHPEGSFWIRTDRPLASTQTIVVHLTIIIRISSYYD